MTTFPDERTFLITLIAGVFGGFVRGYSRFGFSLAVMPILMIAVVAWTRHWLCTWPVRLLIWSAPSLSLLAIVTASISLSNESLKTGTRVPEENLSWISLRSTSVFLQSDLRWHTVSRPI
ncbi:hypothetical protein [Tardiphaga sp. 42S5]|uniref:hypothetical protein n=1 Tax=Tardiphaga sp. 42S5 TaxID=1404799 RepID=UPI002A5A0A45|nr:hypothetical protein [Tardiphaga sp. 42S5]WPO42195.1 hypothetical protein SFY93_03220 [Tardiphaga sp. 42S5]